MILVGGVVVVGCGGGFVGFFVFVFDFGFDFFLGVVGFVFVLVEYVVNEVDVVVNVGDNYLFKCVYVV